MSKLKVIAIFIVGILMGIFSFSWLNSYIYQEKQGSQVNPIGVKRELPYDKYTFEKLVTREPKPSTIEIGRVIEEEETYTSSVFYYTSEGRRISGQINIPMTPMSNKMPVIVMARGYVDKEIYTIGMGTKNAAAYYATHGYITLAPDFSGYGESEQEDENALGARLTKPVEILDLLASVSTLPPADTENIYLWGHSNGGQIMLSVLEILGKKQEILSSETVNVKGATLWAPVSKPFPYSVLYYTDEADDKGKWLRLAVAEFERDYDVYNYSIDWYWDWIQTPILLHQGTADEAVPKRWSDELVKTLEEKEKEINYYLYPGADHNLRGGWDSVVTRDVAFFRGLL